MAAEHCGVRSGKRQRQLGLSFAAARGRGRSANRVSSGLRVLRRSGYHGSMAKMLSAQSRPNIGRGGEKAAGREARAARLAAALKSNLRRRKAQARERASEDEGAQ